MATATKTRKNGNGNDNGNGPTLGEMVDRYSVLNAEIKERDSEREIIKRTFFASGFDKIPNVDGTITANVISVEGKQKTDWEAVARAMGAPQALIDAHTEQGAGYMTLRLTSPKVATK